jgi:hypothetical protein
MSLPKMEAAFKKVISSVPFDYKFVDEEYGLKFAEEERIGTSGDLLCDFIHFYIPAWVCLASHHCCGTTHQRDWRQKSTGSFGFQSRRLLSKDFIVLVVISA